MRGSVYSMKCGEAGGVDHMSLDSINPAEAPSQMDTQWALDYRDNESECIIRVTG